MRKRGGESEALGLGEGEDVPGWRRKVWRGGLLEKGDEERREGAEGRCVRRFTD